MMKEFKQYLAETEKNKLDEAGHELMDPSQPYALANPRIIKVGDEPNGIYDYAVLGPNYLSTFPFSKHNWNNEQYHARTRGYILKYVGNDPDKAAAASGWMGPEMKMGHNMRGEKLAELTTEPVHTDDSDHQMEDLRRLSGLKPLTDSVVAVSSFTGEKTMLIEGQ
jgi:hypothetical protein